MLCVCSAKCNDTKISNTMTITSYFLSQYIDNHISHSKKGKKMK